MGPGRLPTGRTPRRRPPSRDVAVLVCGRLAALDVLLVYEDLDALLDHADAGIEPGSRLADHLLDEGVVPKHLPRFHDTNYSSLQVHLPVFVDGTPCLLHFLWSILLHRRGDFKLCSFTAEVHV